MPIATEEEQVPLSTRVNSDADITVDQDQTVGEIIATESVGDDTARS